MILERVMEVTGGVRLVFEHTPHYLGNREFVQEGIDRLEPDLMEQYEGLYVAIRNGQVLDSDLDEITLVMRVYEKFGYGPMYVRQVGAPLPVRRIMSPRVVRA